jgi:DNA gyrase inhibitor GyrI
VAPTPVAILEHRGDRATLGATIERFIAWRKAAGLSPETSSTFNINDAGGAAPAPSPSAAAASPSPAKR